MITPNELAKRMGIDPKRLRGYLRYYWKQLLEHEKGKRWNIEDRFIPWIVEDYKVRQKKR